MDYTKIFHDKTAFTRWREDKSCEVPRGGSCIGR